MIWKILIIITLILSGWSVWGIWQNTQTIGIILDIINHLTNYSNEGE